MRTRNTDTYLFMYGYLCNDIKKTEIHFGFFNVKYDKIRK